MYDTYSENNSVNSSYSSSGSNRIKMDVAREGYHGALMLLASTSSDCMPGTPRMSIVYLDDLEEKSVNQERCKHEIDARTSLDSSDGNAILVTDPRTTALANKRSLEKSALLDVQSRPSSKWDNDKDRRSTRGFYDELPKNNPLCFRHVHPKLPNYEDLVSDLTDISAEYRQSKSSSSYERTSVVAWGCH